MRRCRTGGSGCEVSTRSGLSMRSGSPLPARSSSCAGWPRMRVRWSSTRSPGPRRACRTPRTMRTSSRSETASSSPIRSCVAGAGRPRCSQRWRLPMSSLAAAVPVADSVDTLLAGASAREPIVDGAGKSGARLERVVIDGQRYVVKYLHLADDWTMRAAGDLSGAAFTAWRRGLLARMPDCINQPIVGVCKDPGGSAVLMRDVSQWLVPVTDKVIPLEQHLRFLDHMAAMHATFWDAGQEVEVIPVMHRYLELSVWIAEAEAAIGSTHLVPRLIGQGWAMLGDVAPRAAAVVVPLSVDPGPLVEALEQTPQTFVHGNWKLDNLGTDAVGRTVLLDWESTGRGAALSDLAWYLAINCRRLPQTKEEAIDTYRGALERHGVDTARWWDTQLALCLLGGLVQFGWEKALGGYDDELAWWEARAIEGADLLGWRPRICGPRTTSR